MKVSPEVLFPANPSILDGVDDLIQLSYLNEPSVLHNLRVRFTQNCVYVSATFPFSIFFCLWNIFMCVHEKIKYHVKPSNWEDMENSVYFLLQIYCEALKVTIFSSLHRIIELQRKGTLFRNYVIFWYCSWSNMELCLLPQLSLNNTGPNLKS